MINKTDGPVTAVAFTKRSARQSLQVLIKIRLPTLVPLLNNPVSQIRLCH